MEVLTVGSIEDAVLQLAGSPWAYVAVAVVLVVGSLVVFLPSQALVVALGTLLIGRGDPVVPVGFLVLAAAVGMLLGDLALFLAARRVDIDSWSLLDRRRVRDARSSIDGRYRKTPARIAVLGRFIPMGRLATNLVGADSDLSLRRFVISCGIADLVWAAYCVGIAAVTGHWAREYPFVVTAIAVALSIALGVGIGAVERAFRRRADGRAAAATAG
jgi:membrane-associated protein